MKKVLSNLCVLLILFVATVGCHGLVGNWRTQNVYVPTGHEMPANPDLLEPNSNKIANASKGKRSALDRPQPPNVLPTNDEIENKYQQISSVIKIQEDQSTDGLVFFCSGLGGGVLGSAIVLTSKSDSGTVTLGEVVGVASSVLVVYGLIEFMDSEIQVGSLRDKKIDLLHESRKIQGLLNINNGNKISLSIPQIELANGKATATIASMTF